MRLFLVKAKSGKGKFFRTRGKAMTHARAVNGDSFVYECTIKKGLTAKVAMVRALNGVGCVDPVMLGKYEKGKWLQVNRGNRRGPDVYG